MKTGDIAIRVRYNAQREPIGYKIVEFVGANLTIEWDGLYSTVEGATKEIENVLGKMQRIARLKEVPE